MNTTYVEASSGFLSFMTMIFVGYWNFAIFRHWRQNKLDTDNGYPAIQGEQQNISLTVDKNVSGDENQPRKKEGTDENKLVVCLNQSVPAQAKDSLSPEDQQLHTDQHNATMKQFHIRMKKKHAKDQAFVRSLLVVFLLTVLCFLPYGIITIIRLTNASYVISIKAVIFTIVMVYFNCSVNWIVYGVMNRSFRRRYVTLVRRLLGTCCRCLCPRSQWLDSTRIVFIIIGSMEIVSAVVGNSLLLIVLLTNRSLIMRSFHYLFIANLAMADLVSVLSLMSISVNRYLHVCHYHLYSRVFSLPRVIVWCLLLWVVAAALCLPPFFGVSFYGYERLTHTCAYDSRKNSKYIRTISSVFCIVPMVFVGYWNFAIFRYWRQNKFDAVMRYQASKEQQQNFSLSKDKNAADSENRFGGKEATVNNKQMGSQTPPAKANDSVTGDERPTVHYATTIHHIHIKEAREKEQAFVRSLLVVFLLMALCFLPFGIAAVIRFISPSHAVTVEAGISVTVMVLFNSSVNWIVYGVMNRSFRRLYITLVRRVLDVCCRCPCPEPLWTNSPMEAQGNVNTTGVAQRPVQCATTNSTRILYSDIL
nr:hypothetical protein BaRGS_034562 [Batillaria attramentaria]